MQIAHYLLHPDMRNSLDIISENYLGYILKEERDVLGRGEKKKMFSEIEHPRIIDYACERSLALFNLSEVFQKEMAEKKVIQLFDKIELPLSRVLAKMELEGIAIDVKRLNSFIQVDGRRIGRNSTI